MQQDAIYNNVDIYMRRNVNAATQDECSEM